MGKYTGNDGCQYCSVNVTVYRKQFCYDYTPKSVNVKFPYLSEITFNTRYSLCTTLPAQLYLL